MYQKKNRGDFSISTAYPLTKKAKTLTVVDLSSKYVHLSTTTGRKSSF